MLYFWGMKKLFNWLFGKKVRLIKITSISARGLEEIYSVEINGITVIGSCTFSEKEAIETYEKTVKGHKPFKKKAVLKQGYLEQSNTSK